MQFAMISVICNQINRSFSVKARISNDCNEDRYFGFRLVASAVLWFANRKMPLVFKIFLNNIGLLHLITLRN